MEFKNYLKVLILATLFLLCLSCACAGDVDQANNVTSTYSELNNDIPGTYSELNNDIPGTYRELYNDIAGLQTGDTYNLSKDYYFESNGLSLYYPIIDIKADNVTINGNEHVIDAGNDGLSIFQVTGNNVRIFNLTFTNSYPCYRILDWQSSDKADIYQSNVSSPLSWYGNNGVLSDCVFSGNTAVKGGAVYWSGNEGLIDNCLFINNKAKIGGGLFIGGTNNTVSNTQFVNCSSITGEAIYAERNRKNLTFNNNSADSNILLIDGASSKLDVNKYINYHYLSLIGDELVDIVPLIYSVFTKSDINYYNNNIYYYGMYSKDTNEFALSITKNFGDVSYTKNYIFSNIADYNKIYEDLFYNNENYVNSYNFVKNVYITSQITAFSDYYRARNTNIAAFTQFFNTIKNHVHGEIDAKNIMLKIVGFSAPVTLTLNINFLGAYEICYLDAIVVDETGFDIINIYGHGSKIYSNGEDDDEYTWIQNSQNKIVQASDLIIEGFNTAVVNKGGTCIFNNVQFNKNKVDYLIKTDNGGAILNEGIVLCNNCSFTENYAKNGGAIFNQGALITKNCTFKDNAAYGQGNDIVFVEGSQVIINGENITGDTNIAKLYDDSMNPVVVGVFVFVGFLVVVGAISGLIFLTGGFIGTLIGGCIAMTPLGATMLGSVIATVAYGGIATTVILVYDATCDNDEDKIILH